MILDTEQREMAVPESLVRAIIQVNVRYFKGLRIERAGINSESMILRCNLNVLCEKVLYRMVPAAVTELELECRSSKRKRKKLVAKTDAEDGLLPDELLDVLYRNRDCRRITGAVGEKDAVRILLENLIRRKIHRNNGDVAPVAGEPAQDILFDPEIVGNDVEASPVQR